MKNSSLDISKLDCIAQSYLAVFLYPFCFRGLRNSHNPILKNIIIFIIKIYIASKKILSSKYFKMFLMPSEVFLPFFKWRGHFHRLFVIAVMYSALNSNTDYVVTVKHYFTAHPFVLSDRNRMVPPYCL